MGKFKPLLLATLLGLAGAASAQTLVMTFEGISDQRRVGEFYNGGLGGFDLDLGVSFSTAAIGLIDSDAPAGPDGRFGTGVFSNEPSGSTVLTFAAGTTQIVVNVPAGFTQGYSTYYVSTDNAFLRAWSGLNGTGTQLAELALEDQKRSCPGDPLPINGSAFGCWDTEGVTFNGVALSLTINGTRDQTAFDNLTLGSDVAGLTQTTAASLVPEPGSAAMLALGLIGLLRLRRQR